MQFSVNGHEFFIKQIARGAFADKWCWSTDDDESLAFDEPYQAQQDAMRYIDASDLMKAHLAEQEADEAKYGRYDEQVRDDHMVDIKL